ncbi:MAG: hypothetical protein ACLRFE_04025 [Clostridia bacterium]
MIIQKMIKHNVDDFYFAFNISVNAVALLLKKDDKHYYDLRHDIVVDESRVRAIKPFSKYMQIDKQKITITEGIDLATDHYMYYCRDVVREKEDLFIKNM